MLQLDDDPTPDSLPVEAPPVEPAPTAPLLDDESPDEPPAVDRQGWPTPQAMGFDNLAHAAAVIGSDNPAKAARDYAAQKAAEAPAPEPPTEQALATRNLSLVEQAQALQVTDAESFRLAEELLRVLAEAEDRVHAFLDDDIQRAHAAWSGLTKKRKAMLDPIEGAKKDLGIRYAAFDRAEKARAEEDRRRREQAARDAEAARLRREAEALEQEAERAAAEQGPAVAEDLRQEAASVRQEAASVPTPVLPLQRAVAPAKGISTRENWTFEVTDKLALVKAVAAGQVSLEALDANPTYLRGRAKADKGTLNIPGVRVYDAGTTAVRRK